MNAFHRGEAIDHAESLSFIIAVHLLLIASFPEDGANEHWSKEIDGFRKTLMRYNKSKRKKPNYNSEILFDIISEHLEDEGQKEAIETHLHAKDLPINNLKWNEAQIACKEFSDSVVTI